MLSCCTLRISHNYCNKQLTYAMKNDCFMRCLITPQFKIIRNFSWQIRILLYSLLVFMISILFMHFLRKCQIFIWIQKLWKTKFKNHSNFFLVRLNTSYMCNHFWILCFHENLVSQLTWLDSAVIYSYCKFEYLILQFLIYTFRILFYVLFCITSLVKLLTCMFLRCKIYNLIIN